MTRLSLGHIPFRYAPYGGVYMANMRELSQKAVDWCEADIRKSRQQSWWRKVKGICHIHVQWAYIDYIEGYRLNVYNDYFSLMWIVKRRRTYDV